MFRVCLINMPFAPLAMPSLGLEQLKAVVERDLADTASVEVLYPNLDFAAYLGGPGPYGHALSLQSYLSGYGDWFFRQAAFPDAEDNTADYLHRFYFGEEQDARDSRRLVEEKRTGIPAFLDELTADPRVADADLVGFTALFAQTTASVALAKRIKRRNPDAVTVLGGPACEGSMGREYARQLDCFDAVFSGPALVSFPRFVRACLEGDRQAGDRINGVFTRANTAPSHRCDPPHTGSCPDVVGDALDIDSLPDPDFTPFLDALDEHFAGGEVKPALLFQTSHGCWWAEKSPCSFCGLNGLQHRYRAMKPDRALRAIRSLFRYVPRCRFFEAVDNVAPRNYFTDVFPGLETPPGVKIQYETRPDLTETEIATLCAAGVTAIQPGIESLSTATLRLMNKGTTAFRNIRFMKDCCRHPVSMAWNLLVFSPGEQDATYDKALHDIPRLTHLPPPEGAFPVNVVRFSRTFEQAKAFGLDLKPQDFYGFTFPFDERAIRNIAYHFADRRADTEHMDARLDALNTAIAAWRTRWFNHDRRLESRLCLLEDGRHGAVYDSRTGTAAEYPVDEFRKRLLLFLEEPRSAAEAVSHFGAEHESRTREGLRFLDERGLLFEEDGRFLSLVIVG